jgi:hypothetical protein
MTKLLACNFLDDSIIFSLASPNIPLGILFSDILNLYSSLRAKTNFQKHIKH